MNTTTREFALMFRMDITTPGAQPSTSQMEEYMRNWGEWINTLSSKGVLVGGHHFSEKGMVLKPGKVIDEMPYVADGLSVAGYFIVSVMDMDEATKVAQECPILKGQNTSVEIRELAE